MRYVTAILIALVLTFAGVWTATQFIASVFDFQPALGAPLMRFGETLVYSPFAIFDWQDRFGASWPRPFAAAGVILLAGLMAGLGAAALALRAARRPAPFGADAWGGARDAEEAGLFAPSGTVLGKLGGEILCFDGPEHQLLTGASRSGKGRGHIVPTLLTWGGSAFVLDVKGELADGDRRYGFPGTAGFRETLGPVLRFAPTRESSAHFNPLFEVRRGPNEVRDVQNIVEIITDPAGDGRHSEFWDLSARQVLTGVILHVIYAEPDERKTLAVVREKLRDLKATTELMRRTLHRIDPATGLPETHPEVLHAAVSFDAGEERLQAGIKATAESFFGLFADPLVAARTSRSDFRIADLMCAERPVTLYLQPPPSDAARLMPLMRLMLNQMARALMEHQESGPNLEPKRHRLLLCLDEFPQLGKLPFFETMMGTMAGYGIKAYLVCQSLNHITRAYGRDNVILDNCHIVTAFAAADMSTARRLAEMAGEVWEERPQATRHLPSPVLGPRKGSITYREERRPLLLPGDVRQLKRDEQLIFVNGSKPLRTRKLRFDTEAVFAARLLPASRINPSLTLQHDWTGQRAVSVAAPAPTRAPRPSSFKGRQGDLFSQAPELAAPAPGPVSQAAVAGLPASPPAQTGTPAPVRRPRRTGI